MTGEPASPWRSRAFGMLGAIAWIGLAVLALARGDGLLAAACAFALVVVVLAPRLAARRVRAWIVLAVVAVLLGALVQRGHGLFALEALPVLVNLALAWLFGHTLVAGRRPLIARVILALEGEERLAERGVAAYARGLTLAWTLLLLAQAFVFAWLLGVRHGLLGWPPRVFAETWLVVGGWLVPIVFMVAELAFRRRRLPHVRHDPPRVFLQRLATNWPRLLRDTVR
ncbi:MAG: xanthomonadin biosynthesis protein [Xanthomonadales bacterium]|nr:xanthomonadin biosynthesis protein [Xanthomonadales bacterium]